MNGRTWPDIRAEFPLDPRWINFAGMSLTSHPRAVSAAIDEHRRAFDAAPYLHVRNLHVAETAVADAAGRYFGLSGSLIAATGSTTMGLAQLYGGLRVKPGQEILTSRQEHFTTTETLQARRRRDGTAFRRVALFADSARATEDEILSNLEAEIRPETRALALAWVYSSNGLKMPIAAISKLVQQENSRRAPGDDALLLCVDGVHGFGVEDVGFSALGCDLFVSGCHKWIFGPRGTGIFCGTEEAWRHVVPLVTSFSRIDLGPGRVHTPGGIHAYEHAWALEQAFDFVMSIGKAAIQRRVRELTRRLKDGLRANPRIQLRTPDSDELSSGIVCFDVDGLAPKAVCDRLLDAQIIATVSAWDAADGRDHVRLSVSILNNEDEIQRVLDAL